MSELGDAVRAQLTDEWRTTIEIADSIPKPGRKDLSTHREMVRQHLVSLAKYGIAERKDGDGLVKWRKAR